MHSGSWCILFLFLLSLLRRFDEKRHECLVVGCQEQVRHGSGECLEICGKGKLAVKACLATKAFCSRIALHAARGS